MTLDLHDDVVSLTRALCDIPSVSGAEAALADAVEAALRKLGHLEVLRDGDAVVARTNLGRDRRIVLAGHLDTVPIKDNLPTWTTGEGDAELLYGRGTCDMKAGLATQLRIAATVTEPRHDLTLVCYDNEEVASVKNGLGRLVRNHPEWLAGDFAILGEPSNAGVEGGCQGTMRVRITLAGKASHAARAWAGRNAIHLAAPVLAILAAYEPRRVTVDGLEYREGLNAVNIQGGIAGNVIPDACVVDINHRFAPDRSVDDAYAHLCEVFAGYDLEIRDQAPGARPGLDLPAAAEFVAVVGREPAPKFGWTDVARFAELGIPAVNYAPGDPLLAHTDDEHVPTAQIRECERVLRDWLS
ncbi:succinyl-diaminopimelate desuccinylase [Pseudosporangium ferrugineum]|uniref:Succinyl-diaminopimelate desuccinylase n=1 Tax=Pseudosporangium ferrugineum TaxID=439699 RepID=A0A2T0S1Z3_9ACTN|nr:succinyl-diaminopimelate desuccinylase [Pseudosporangium ferrugineum]PRY27435.1 succinyldiaminopimelate desuccinylase [Pseudosporangium ferrugineum]